MRKTFLIQLTTLFLLFLTLLSVNLVMAAPVFNQPVFANTWNRVDRPVQEIPNVGRGYTWGPTTGANPINEAYNGGTRQVQYFDKARMEINNFSGNPNDLFYITTGLLIKELVTGLRQDGDNSFTPFPPSQVQVAGDPNDSGSNTIAPTYASFKNIVTFAGNQNWVARALGSLITSQLDRPGNITSFTPPEVRRLKAYDDITSHNIADVFVDYGNQNGLIWSGSRYSTGAVFFGNPTYVLGRPVTEPYWVRAVVGGVEQYVLVQLFERRALTYTPSNPSGFKVEMGNVGQHYYRWRYIENNLPPPPPPPPPIPATPPLDVGINALLNIYNLPQLGAYTQTYEASSHEPAGENFDRSNYLYQEDKRYIIFDQRGSGSVYRIWMTSTPITDVGRIQFFLDDEASPRLDLPVTTFFSGKSAPFLTPLVGNAAVSSGGFYSYVPIPYTTRLRIATTGKPGYFQIDYQKINNPKYVSSFTGKEDYGRLLNVFNNIGQDPKPANPGRQTISGNGALRANGQLKLGSNLLGPGVISAIKLKMDFSRVKVFSSTFIQVNLDGRPWNHVDLPLDYFFGSGIGERKVAGLMSGIDPANHQYYFYFPMPFHNVASISLLNKGDNTAQVDWEISFDPDPTGKLVTPDTGYFYAIYKQEREPADGQDYNILKFKGRGRYVGTVLNIYSHYSAMEGDTRIYLDDSSTPQLYGTGVEDYFNGGFGFNGGPFSRPLHGTAATSLANPTDGFKSLVGWRFQLGDAPTFNSGIKIGVEHGYIGNDRKLQNEIYSSAAFWYGLDDPTLEQTDALNVGDPGAARDHNYSNDSSARPKQLTSSYEGENDSQLVTDYGMEFQGYSSFTANIEPDNAGVILRRRFDFNNINLQANVYVDGQFVGRWYSPGQNQFKRWRDEDFVIPATFTRGKKNIKVRLEVIADPSPWNEFYYVVYSIRPGIGYIP